jgi:hypothetical protein
MPLHSHYNELVSGVLQVPTVLVFFWPLHYKDRYVATTVFYKRDINKASLKMQDRISYIATIIIYDSSI